MSTPPLEPLEPPALSDTSSKPGLGSEYNPLVSPQLDNPHPFYARARREEPVFYSPALSSWVVTRYADVCTVLADPVRFSSAQSTSLGTPLPPQVLQVLQQGLPYEPSLVDNDPPAHTRFRYLVNKALTPRRITEREPLIRDLAHELVNGFVHEGRCDLFDRFAYTLTALVIGRVMGISRADAERFRQWSDQWLCILGARGTVDSLLRCARGVVEFQERFTAIIEERKASPRDDLLNDILSAAQGLEEPASLAELISVLMQVLTAGHETTSGLIACTVELLLRHPEQLQAVRDDLELLPGAVEEALRLASPVTAMFRTATEEVELGGVRLPKGAHLRLSFTSANHDETRHTEPERFDIRRTTAKGHLSFGHGIHFCLGAPLARMEARIALEVLLERLPGLRLAPHHVPSMLPGITIRRLTRLDVEWEVPGERGTAPR